MWHSTDEKIKNKWNFKTTSARPSWSEYVTLGISRGIYISKAKQAVKINYAGGGGHLLKVVMSLLRPGNKSGDPTAV